MRAVLRFLPSLLVISAVVLGLGLNSNQQAFGQSNKKTTKKPALSPAELRALQERTHKSQADFVLSQVELAQEYEKAGLLEESKGLLQLVRKMSKDLPGLERKIKLLEESILSDNPFEFQLDTSKGWGDPIARVEKGKPIRILAGGKYRLSFTGTVDAKGVATNDKTKDMARGVRLGALMALVVPISDKGKVGKPGDQIEIGAGKEFSPGESGLLFLTVNVPPGSRCTGKIEIQLSGYVKSPK